MRWYPSQSCVQSQLANRYSHALSSQVTKSQNSLPVRHNNCSHISLRPVLDNIIDMALVMDGYKQTLNKNRSNPALTETIPTCGLLKANPNF